MIDLLQRIDKINSILDEIAEREQKANEFRKLTQKFASLNEKLVDLAWACPFVIEISEKEDLSFPFKEMKEKYEDFRKDIVKWWGDPPDKIDILEPSAYYERIDELLESCEKLESEVQEALNVTKNSIDSKYELAKTLSKIPDMEIDFRIFEKAIDFLLQIGKNAHSIAQFVKWNKKIFSKKLEEWKSIISQIKKEQEKLSLKKVHDKTISDKTGEFIKKFMENDCEIDFDFLDSEIVNELKEKLPGLCRKLKVMMG
jgi:tetratricopeptide (TPR) repeat protein